MGRGLWWDSQLLQGQFKWLIGDLVLLVNMSGKARQVRDEWKAKLVGASQSLMQVCEVSPLVKRAVTRKMGEMEAIWDKLVKGHSLYCKSAWILLGSSESTEYLRDKARLREEAVQAAETALGEGTEDESVAVVKRLKKSVEMLKAEVEFTIPTLTDFSAE